MTLKSNNLNSFVRMIKLLMQILQFLSHQFILQFPYL